MGAGDEGRAIGINRRLCFCCFFFFLFLIVPSSYFWLGMLFDIYSAVSGLFFYCILFLAVVSSGYQTRRLITFSSHTHYDLDVPYGISCI